MRAQHTAVGATKTLECQQCNRSFTRPENLARHAKTRMFFVHSMSVQMLTGIAVGRRRSPSSSLPDCGKQFSRSDLRRKHERLHERSTSSRKATAGVNSKPKSTAAAATGSAERPPIIPDDSGLAHMTHGSLELPGEVLPAVMSPHDTDHIMVSVITW